MKDLGKWAAAGLLVASSHATASTTAHVGVFSEYVFRGVVANGGAAVQGGIDYHNDNGILAGVWASNANAFGGSEFDLYAGYLYPITETIMVDAGALYYILPEDKENLAINPTRRDLDTLEWFVTVFAGPVKLQAYYSHDYVATRDEAYYYTASYTHTINPTITVTLQAGYTDGDGAVAIYGDEYTDYSLTVAKTVREGLEFTLTAVDTTLEDEGAFVGTDDDPKVVIGLKQTFDF